MAALHRLRPLVVETPTPTPVGPESRPWAELAALARERAAVEEEARAPPPPDAVAYARLEMPERGAPAAARRDGENPFL